MHFVARMCAHTGENLCTLFYHLQVKKLDVYIQVNCEFGEKMID